MNFEKVTLQVEPPELLEEGFPLNTLSPHIKIDLKMNDNMMILNGVVYEEVTDESVLCVPVSDTLFDCNIDSGITEQNTDSDDLLDEHNYHNNNGDVINNLNMFFTSVINNKTSTKLLECTLCQKVMKTPGAFYRHVRIHTGEKPYQCELCNKKFSQQSNLWKHVLIHTGEKRFKCPSCNRKFSQRANMQKHMMVHTGEKPFTCYICSRTFTQRANLNKHIRIHTGEKPYTCKFCNRQFAQQSNMQKHELLHQGLKPFTCNICSAAFTQQSNLKKHLCTHSTLDKVKLNKYACIKCNRYYNSKNGLCKHIEKCTENESYKRDQLVVSTNNEDAYVDVCSSENNEGRTENKFIDEYGFVIRK